MGLFSACTELYGDGKKDEDEEENIVMLNG